MVNIRKAEIEDLSYVAPLFNQYRIFYKQPADINAAESFIKERLLKNESVFFLAFEDEQGVGFVQLYPIFSSVSVKRSWLLNDLFVHESFRNKGVAALLLDAAKSFAKETDSKFLLLQTAHDNYAAQKLYNKNGWKQVTDLFYEFDLC